MKWRGDTRIDVPKVSARSSELVHMILWYNAVIGFSSESDSGLNNELRLSKWENKHRLYSLVRGLGPSDFSADRCRSLGCKDTAHNYVRLMASLLAFILNANE